MKKIKLTLLGLLLVSGAVAQVKLGDNPTVIDQNAVIEMESTSKGMLPPRLSTAQRDAITGPAKGLVIYNTTRDCLEYYNGSLWVSNCGGSISGAGVPDCNSKTLNGIYQVGQAMTGNNYVTIPVQVITAGSWSASTNTVNGITFSGGGIFTQPGAVTSMVLYAGPGAQPASNGTFTYSLSLGSATCNFDVTYSSLPGCAVPSPALSFATPNANTWALQAGTSRTFTVSGGATNSTSFTYSIIPTTGVSAPSGNIIAGSTSAITFNNAGNYTITFTSANAGNGSCAASKITASNSFEVVSGPPLPSATVCPTNNRINATSLPSDGSTFTVSINGVSTVIARSGAANPLYVNNSGSCGIPMNGTAINVANQQLAFTFDQPVSNVQVISGMDKAVDQLTFTALNGFTDVSSQLVLSKMGTCPSNTTQTANNAIKLISNGSNNMGVTVGGVYYTTLIITHTGENAEIELGLCQASTNSCQAPSALTVLPTATALYGNIAAGNNTITFNATGGTPNTGGMTWSVSPTSGVTSATSGTGSSAAITWNSAASGMPYTVTFSVTNSGSGGCNPVTIKGSSTVSVGVFTTAKDLLIAKPTAASGPYYIDPDGSGTGFSPIQIYCDMVNDGGGWMLIGVGSGEAAGTEASSMPALSGNLYLARTIVTQLAANCSDVTVRNSTSHAAPFGNKLISNNSNPITALRSSSYTIDGPSTWMGSTTSWTVTGAYQWNKGCTSAVTSGWPNMYHACGNPNGVHFIGNQYGYVRSPNSIDAANSVWIR